MIHAYGSTANTRMHAVRLRWPALQEEVEALARKEMSGRAAMLPAGSSSSSGSGSSRDAASSSGAAAVMDAQAAVDELRAEIAYARASLQQIKNAPPAEVASS